MVSSGLWLCAGHSRCSASGTKTAFTPCNPFFLPRPHSFPLPRVVEQSSSSAACLLGWGFCVFYKDTLIFPQSVLRDWLVGAQLLAPFSLEGYWVLSELQMSAQADEGYGDHVRWPESGHPKSAYNCTLGCAGQGCEIKGKSTGQLLSV